MARKRGGSASANGTDATITAAACNAHYQFSPKFIMKTLANLKYYPETAFNEVRLLYCSFTLYFCFYLLYFVLENFHLNAKKNRKNIYLLNKF